MEKRPLSYNSYFTIFLHYQLQTSSTTNNPKLIQIHCVNKFILTIFLFYLFHSDAKYWIL